MQTLVESASNCKVHDNKSHTLNTYLYYVAVLADLSHHQLLGYFLLE